MKISELIKLVNDIPVEHHDNEVVLALPSVKTNLKVLDRVQIGRAIFEPNENLGAVVLNPTIVYVSKIEKIKERNEALNVLKNRTIIALDRVEDTFSQVTDVIEAYREGTDL